MTLPPSLPILRSCVLGLAAIFFFPQWAEAQVGACTEAEAEAFLDVGNVSARMYNDGPIAWKGGQNHYEVPKGSGIHAIFASTFMIGGLIDNELHMAASTFGNYEFWPGPLDEQGIPPADCSVYDQIWEVNEDDFIQLDREGVITDNMRDWPWELGAPVIDGDGISDNYNLEGGDRPELLGNQTLWWIMNDRGNEHRWSETPPIGLEVRVSAYAFDHGGSAGNITFYRYHITNKNTAPLKEAFLAMWSDPDLGNASDDYYGSDSLLHLAYVYNGDDDDENAYEQEPPALGYAFLITPEAEVDSLDNDRDGEVDEPGEQTGMYASTQFFGGGGPIGDPSDGEEIYLNMQGKWHDKKSMIQGGSGYPNDRDWPDGFPMATTRFFYSGDPLSQSFWSEFSPFPDVFAPQQPGDRRMFGSSGPFTLLPGESDEFLLAIIWAQGEDRLDSVRKLKAIAGNLVSAPENYVISGILPDQTEPFIPEPQYVLGFDQNFPNPFSSTTTLRYSLPKSMTVRLAVYDVLGREVAVLAEGFQDAGVYAASFDGTRLPPGFYIAQIELDHLTFTKKMVRIP